MSQPAELLDRDETDAEIVARLQRTWDIWGARTGDPLKRLINCLDSGSDVNLSGIDRDLIVYAMAHSALSISNGERADGA